MFRQAQVDIFIMPETQCGKNSSEAGEMQLTRQFIANRYK